MKTKRRLLLSSFIFAISSFNTAFGQSGSALRDSIWVSVMPKYDSVSKLHRKIFGENYRKEYALSTKLPMLHLSTIAGGLNATQRGGGNQTRSLRLQDHSGNEWVLRSVEKYPEVLLPKSLQETFLKEVIKDNMSAQHPFSALVVPVLSKAAGLPFSSPIIGVVADDPGLGIYAKEFVGTVALLEEREPIGKTDNTAKMHQRLNGKGDYNVNAAMLLKLKCLDVLLGDWDRHDDQWRWHAEKTDAGNTYIPVPRDRDQVFFKSEGKIQRSSQSSWLLPMMQGYEKGISNINWFLWEGREINSRWFNEIDEVEWDKTVKEFCGEMTDAVLKEALSKLPEPGKTLREPTLFKEMADRRERLPSLMNQYYHFFNRIVDIELSAKDEIMKITDTDSGGLNVTVSKSNGSKGPNVLIYQRVFDPRVTKEVRIYLHEGNDSLIIDNKKSLIKMRITGGSGNKEYVVNNSRKRIGVNEVMARNISGAAANKISVLVSRDSSLLNYQPKDLYSRHFIYPNIGFNVDDGLALGAGATFVRPGYRKSPYGQSHSLSFLYSFATGAFRFNYSGEWLQALGKADVIVKANILGPSNTQNFFGVGNETHFDENANNITYYRARFNLYDLSGGLRWRINRSTVGTELFSQSYHYDVNENVDRFISQPSLLHSADSLVIDRNKMFAGISIKYTLNTRDNNLLPNRGIFLDIKANGFKGLNEYSNSIVQINPAFSFHQRLDKSGRWVFSERIGGGVTIGKPAFYQSQFLGGNGNLMGYRQFRFAGQHSIYNNAEIRVKLANLVSYVLPGQLGLIGLYDVGRVWKDGEESNIWHHGVGGGIYFAPASIALFRLTAAYSKEGVYPAFAMAWRY